MFPPNLCGFISCYPLSASGRIWYHSTHKNCAHQLISVFGIIRYFWGILGQDHCLLAGIFFSDSIFASWLFWVYFNAIIVAIFGFSFFQRGFIIRTWQRSTNEAVRSPIHQSHVIISLHTDPFFLLTLTASHRFLKRFPKTSRVNPIFHWMCSWPSSCLSCPTPTFLHWLGL